MTTTLFTTKKLVVFDLDGTLIEGNTWLSFNLAMGLSPQEDTELFLQYQAGTISYQTWIDSLNHLYTRSPRKRREVVETTLQNSYTLRTGAEETVAAIRARGYKIALLTGSFELTVRAVGAQLGIEHIAGNATAHFDEHNLFTHITVSGEERSLKVRQLEHLCHQLALQPTDAVVVGDRGNDLDIFALSGCGITFTTSSEVVRRAAHLTITDLADLVKFL
jgi:phosphoserine phosphatase